MTFFKDRNGKEITFRSLGKFGRQQYFSYFNQKIGFQISCKLSPKETVCMKSESLFYGISKKNIYKCHLLKFSPWMQSVKVSQYLLCCRYLSESCFLYCALLRRRKSAKFCHGVMQNFLSLQTMYQKLYFVHWSPIEKMKLTG